MTTFISHFLYLTTKLYLTLLSHNHFISQSFISESLYLSLSIFYLSLPHNEFYLRNSLSQLVYVLSQLASYFVLSQKTFISACLSFISRRMKTCSTGKVCIFLRSLYWLYNIGMIGYLIRISVDASSYYSAPSKIPLGPVTVAVRATERLTWLSDRLFLRNRKTIKLTLQALHC